jgi:hypothetical protein
VSRNPRLHVSKLNNELKILYKDKKILDAGLIHFRAIKRGRKEMDQKYIRFVDKNYIPHFTKEPLTYLEQSYYKYILYIEGNVAAYRGAYMFSFKSVVLWTKSPKYHLWFEPLLEHKKNCMLIEHDLSNLTETILWLQDNDAAAKKIADAGYDFYNEYLTRQPIDEYFRSLLNFL